MRISGVSNVSAEVGALIAKNNFPKSDVAWTSCWSNAAGNANPFFYEEFWPGRQKNVTLNVAVERAAEEAQDARLSAYWTRNSDGDIMGWVSSSNNLNSSSKYYSQGSVFTSQY